MQESLHTSEVVHKLRAATVGIAGLGGLGSNAAVALARAGIGRLILVDFDTVELSNLNRQYYMLEDVGKLKTKALAGKLKIINPYVELDVYTDRIDENNCLHFFLKADIVIEAVDDPFTKELIIESILTGSDSIYVIAGSGMGGFGKNNEIHDRKIDRFTVIGDEITGIEEGVPLLAPRVAVVANMQANAAVEILMNRE